MTLVFQCFPQVSYPQNKHFTAKSSVYDLNHHTGFGEKRNSLILSRVPYVTLITKV